MTVEKSRELKALLRDKSVFESNEVDSTCCCRLAARPNGQIQTPNWISVRCFTRFSSQTDAQHLICNHTDGDVLHTDEHQIKIEQAASIVQGNLLCEKRRCLHESAFGWCSGKEAGLEFRECRDSKNCSNNGGNSFLPSKCRLLHKTLHALFIPRGMLPKEGIQDKNFTLSFTLCGNARTSTVY